MLNPVEISDIRRHLGYPAQAVNRSRLGSLSEIRNYGLNQTLMQLDSRLAEMDVTDEAKLTGACLGVVLLTGLDPYAGNTVSIGVMSADFVGARTLTATASTNLTKLGLASQLLAALSQDQTLVGAGFIPGGAFQGSSVLNPDLNPSFILRAPNPFALAASSSGATTAFVSLQGGHVFPQAPVSTNADGTENVLYGYLPILNYLESAIAGVTRNADVAKAGGYVRGRELRERKELQEIWKNKLSNFLGIPRFCQANWGDY